MEDLVRYSLGKLFFSQLHTDAYHLAQGLLRDGRALLSSGVWTVGTAEVRAGLRRHWRHVFVCTPVSGPLQIGWSWDEGCARLVGHRWTLNPQSQLPLPMGSIQHWVQSQYPMLYIGAGRGVRIRVELQLGKGRMKGKLKEPRYHCVLCDLHGHGQVWCW